MGHHDQKPIGVLHEDFALPRLPVADLAPDLTRAGIKRPASRFERLLYRPDARDVHLEHRTAAVESLERRGLPFPATLAQQDLRAFRPLKIRKRFLRPLIGDRKPKAIAPELDAHAGIAYEQLWHQLGPSGFGRRSRPSSAICWASASRPGSRTCKTASFTRSRSPALYPLLALRERDILPLEPLPDCLPPAEITKRLLPGIGILSGSFNGLRQVGSAADPSIAGDVLLGIDPIVVRA